MLHTLPNPVGADKVFQKVNTQLFDLLRSVDVWGSSAAPILQDDWQCFGKVLITERAGQKIAAAQVYSTQGNDYVDAMLDDTATVTSFWLLDDSTADVTAQHVKGQKAALIMFCNLARLYPIIPRGAEEQLKGDLLQSLSHGVLYGLELEGMNVGIERALREFDGPVRDRFVGIADAYPWATIRLNFSLNLSYNDNF